MLSCQRLRSGGACRWQAGKRAAWMSPLIAFSSWPSLLGSFWFCFLAFSHQEAIEFLKAFYAISLCSGKHLHSSREPVSYSFRAATQNTTAWGAYKQQVSSQLWRPEVQGQGASRAVVWWSPPSSRLIATTSSWSPHRAEGARESLGVSFTKAPPSGSNPLPKMHLRHQHRRDYVSTYELGEWDTKIQSIAHING